MGKKSELAIGWLAFLISGGVLNYVFNLLRKFDGRKRE
jgi:hypothetical protein